MEDQEIIALLADYSHPLKNGNDMEALYEKMGRARCVFLGEASHGTKEFYDWRAVISKKLIAKKGFSILAVEGDWPECYEVNRYIKGYSDSSKDAKHALRAFKRWPTWMWGNEEMREFIEWLHEYNKNLPPQNKTGFYGLDVYSLWESMEVVIDHLKKYDSKALETAYKVYSCFEPFGRNEEHYAMASRLISQICHKEVSQLLMAIKEHTKKYGDDPETDFNAEQNAWIIKNAEHYYSTMLKSNEESWNIRDKHMMDSINRLLNFYGPESKIIVWAHNAHIGDARATPMYNAGMVNIGQLARDHYGKENVFLMGFGTYDGEVLAGKSWGSPMMKMKLPPATDGSWEQLMHEVDVNKSIFISEELRQSFKNESREQRSVGMVYHSQSEAGNYVPTFLTERYDAFFYIDRTHPLNPLIPEQTVPEKATPQTYPSTV